MLKPITRDDWNKIEFIEVPMDSDTDVFIRGIRQTRPPDDGYEYMEVTTLSDKEQKWARMMEYVNDDK